MDKIMASYWDRNPGKFRLLISLIGIFAISIISYNLYEYATTVYSGTNYTPLPSKFYITRPLQCRNINTADNKPVSTDTIQTGSFLIEINGNKLKSENDLKELLALNNQNDTVEIKVFNISDAVIIEDRDPFLQYINLAKTYKIKKSDLSGDAVKYLAGGILLGYLEKGGATDRAGLKAGDILLSINENELKINEGEKSSGLTVESLRYLRSFKSGEPIYYKVLRANKEFVFEVKLAVFGLMFSVLLIMIVGIPIIAFGLYLLLKKPGLKAVRLTGLVMLLLGFQIASSFSIYPPEYDIFNYAKIYLNGISLIMLFSLIFHSLCYFPYEHTELLNKKYITQISYTAGILLALIYSIWFFINYKTISNEFILLALTAILVYNTIIRIIFSKKQTPERKKISRVLRITWIFVFLAGFAYPIAYVIFKIKFPDWFGYGFVSCLLLPIVYQYIIWRYRLFDMEFRLKRNIQYSFLLTLWTLILVAGFVLTVTIFSNIYIQFPNFRIRGASIELLPIALEDTSNIFYNKIFFTVASIVAGLLFYKAGKAGKKYFDKKYFREKFDYKTVQAELMRLLESKFTVESLAKIIIEKITGLVHLKRAGAVFFQDENKIWDERSYCYDSLIKTQFCIKESPEIIKYIKKFSGTFSVDYLPAEIRNPLKQSNFRHIVPFKTKERYLGALFIGEKLSETALNNEDIEFLESIVASASVAVENAFLYEELTQQERIKQELAIAHRIQLASLPQKVPRVPGLDICATSIPASEVGGDFYDFLNGSKGKITIVIGDVSGKGTSAALYMSKIQGIFQTLNEFSYSPSQLLTKANRLIYKNIDSKSFITAVGAAFDAEKRTLSFARAGHLPLYHLHNSNKNVNKIQPGGIGIGLSNDDTFKDSLEEKNLEFKKGDIFLLVSDGITESINRAGEQYGEIRLTDFLKNNNMLSSQQICEGILSNVKSFSGDMKQFDDMTLVVVKAE